MQPHYEMPWRNAYEGYSALAWAALAVTAFVLMADPKWQPLPLGMVVISASIMALFRLFHYFFLLFSDATLLGLPEG